MPRQGRTLTAPLWQGGAPQGPPKSGSILPIRTSRSLGVDLGRLGFSAQLGLLMGGTRGARPESARQNPAEGLGEACMSLRRTLNLRCPTLMRP